MSNHSPYQKVHSDHSRIGIKPHYLLSIFIMLGIWLLIIISTTDTQRRFLVPTPGDVAQRLTSMVADGSLLSHLSVTLIEMVLGLLIGTFFALVIGYSVAHSSLFAYLLEPVIVISQAIPIVALAPLLTIWLGPGLPSKVAICSLIVFFPILVNVIRGLTSINPQHRAIFRLLEATPIKTLVHLEIPAALPSFLSGAKVGSTLAGMGAVVGEFVSSTQGLGYLVKQGQNLYDLPMMFAAIFVLMGVTTISYFTMTSLENKFLKWIPNK
jgi:NitT/TauT family transport system permease protein